MQLSLALSLLLAVPAAQGFSIPTPPSKIQPATTSTFTTSTRLFGILDEIESDSYNLLSSNEETDVPMNDAYEVFLGDLVFSTNDPRIDIMNNYDLATDPKFMEWLNNKIDNSRDPDERLALRDLFDMIEDVVTKVQVNQLAEERAAADAEQAEEERKQQAEADAEAGRNMSKQDVLKKAAAIDAAQSGVADVNAETKVKKTFYEQEITPEIRLSYEKLLKQVMPPYKAGDTVNSIVFTFYDQFDAQFVKVLTERSNNGDADARALLEALAQEQQTRIAVAAEALKGVLSLGEPMRMEGAIVKMAREGKIDEPFLLLLEANAQQAKDAGANGPAQLMDKLRHRAADEKDKQASSKEIRLLRQLLRTDDPKKREEIFEDAFTPKDVLLVPGTAENAQKAVDGEAPEQEKPMPDVPPPDFINACKAVLLNFGNLGTDDDRGDLASRIKQLASEAEVVTTRIYGKGMTLREQQDRMWKDQTTSIFDLETMEIEAERMGGRAPWTNEDQGDEILPGFDKDGRMQIGGQ
ncbi:expressed unknown protein [Seminavis robusta]|uniref:Uncharacterized protein n=1 Tax=Seminavis robusta TaxID=568900 RepID=A0A9N8DR09_9STRA|nr:expressed unknown protein [Seminavis robusta]|eukprot:Sro219_g090560.1 n/a (524) ;mRNA; f:69336-71029